MAHDLIHPRTRPLRARFLRALVAVVLFCAVPTGLSGPTPAAAASAAVTWEVKPATKTIELTVNIAVFVDTPPSNGQQQQRLNEVVAEIKRGIMEAWNGQKFKCYTLVVVVNVRLVGGQGDVRNNEVPVRLDTSIYPVSPQEGRQQLPRSRVRTTPYDPSTYLSDSHQFDPGTGPNTAPSVWALAAGPQEFAHEFGHIIGLDDTYVEGVWTTREGAVTDLMTSLARRVDASTVVKAVRRSGQVDESAIKCPLLLELASSKIGLPGFAAIEIEIDGCAPDYDPPSSDPTRRGSVTFVGEAFVKGDYLSGFPQIGGTTDDEYWDFTAPWKQGEQWVVVALPGNEILQQVTDGPHGPLVVPYEAQLRNSGGLIPLGHTMTITPFEGPCP